MLERAAQTCPFFHISILASTSWKAWNWALSNTFTLAAANLLQHTFSLFYLSPKSDTLLSIPYCKMNWFGVGNNSSVMCSLLQLLRRCPLIYRLKLPLQLHLPFTSGLSLWLHHCSLWKSQSHGILKLKEHENYFACSYFTKRRNLRVRAIKWLPSVTELCHGEVVTGACPELLMTSCTSPPPTSKHPFKMILLSWCQASSSALLQPWC